MRELARFSSNVQPRRPSLQGFATRSERARLSAPADPGLRTLSIGD